jgi:hypothetical protein
MNKMATGVNKKHKSLIELVIIVVIIGLLMKLCIEAFLKSQANVTNSLFVQIVQQFTTKVNIVHSAWLTKGQPTVVRLQQLSGTNSQLVPVNTKGWVDEKQPGFRCQRIWQHVLSVPLQIANTEVLAVDINLGSNKDNYFCRYQLTSGEFFEYHPKTGKVKYF